MLTQLIKIRDVVIEEIRARIGRTVRAIGASRVEDHQSEALPETRQVTEVGRRESRPTWMAHEHRPMTQLPVGQLAAVTGGETQARRGSGRQRPFSSRYP